MTTNHAVRVAAGEEEDDIGTLVCSELRPEPIIGLRRDRRGGNGRTRCQAHDSSRSLPHPALRSLRTYRQAKSGLESRPAWSPSWRCGRSLKGTTAGTKHFFTPS